MPRLPRSSPISTARSIAILLALCVMSTAPMARAISLHGGDVVMVVTNSYAFSGGIPFILHLHPATGVYDTLLAQPPLSDPLDIAVRGDGALIVSDASQGVLRVNPVTGVSQVLATLADFGGTAPTAMSFAPSGDLLLAGMFGVMRMPGGSGAPQPVSARGDLIDPRGITSDGGANIWVSDFGQYTAAPLAFGGIVRIDPASGAQTRLTTCCSGFLFPYHPTQVRWSPSGLLYVVNGSPGGPTGLANCGIFTVDPSLGTTTRFLYRYYVAGFALGPGDEWWLSQANMISRDPYGGILEGETYLPHNMLVRGAITLVPSGVTTSRPTSWGALKRAFR